MADVSKIQLPGGTTVNVKDTVSGYQKTNMGSSAANQTVITNSTGDMTTRKTVDGYTIVSALPTTNIDENTVYLIQSSIDPGGGGGGGGSGVTYSLSRTNDTITLTGSDGSTYDVDGGLTQAEVEALIDTIINDVLGRAY